MKPLLLIAALLAINSYAQTFPMLSTTTNRTVTGGVTNLALLNGTNTFSGENAFTKLMFSPASLVYEGSTNVVLDAKRSLSYLTITNTTYIAAATNFDHGASIIIVLKQDASGGWAVRFDTNFWKFPGGYQPSITTNANAIDVISAVASPFSTNFLTVQTPNLK